MRSDALVTQTPVHVRHGIGGIEFERKRIVFYSLNIFSVVA